MTRWSSSLRTMWDGRLAALWGGRRPSPRCGQLAAVTITIFAVAGTLSGCGRYGSPVRNVPVAAVSPASLVKTLDSSSVGPAADESSDRKDADHETDRTDQIDETK